MWVGGRRIGIDEGEWDGFRMGWNGMVLLGVRVVEEGAEI